uniref:Uncharacterized protein n=1 Tax=Opuntia streptacantha TaxID=393608 RepID=A0A7C8YH38_OPUST
MGELGCSFVPAQLGTPSSSLTVECSNHPCVLVEVPNLQHSFAIMQRVLKEAIPSRKCIMLAPNDAPIRQNQPLEQLEIMLSNTVTHIDRPPRNGSRGCMKLGTRVGRLEHVPIRVNKITHPQTVISTMYHMKAL